MRELSKHNRQKERKRALETFPKVKNKKEITPFVHFKKRTLETFLRVKNTKRSYLKSPFIHFKVQKAVTTKKKVRER